MPFVVGETIGSYRLVEQLGQGGMATVYKAYHAALDRYVAIKVLHPALMDESGFQAAQQYLDDQQARLPAAVFGLMRYEQQPEEFSSESLSCLHMDLYRAAREPLFGDFLSKTQANPLFSAEGCVIVYTMGGMFKRSRAAW